MKGTILLYFHSKSFFMSELIQSLQEKVGLTAEQAKDSVNHIMDYIKSKVPASLHEHLDSLSIESVKTKGAEMLAKAQSGGGDLLKSVEEKISGFLHKKES